LPGAFRFPVFILVDEISFKDTIKEPRNTTSKSSRPQAILYGSIEPRYVPELEVIGFGVASVTGLGVQLEGQRLKGCNNTAERVHGT